MQKTYSYFQPAYVSEFKCDGLACNAFCCRSWGIEIDKAAYEKYLRIQCKILQHLTKDGKKYFVALDKNLSCPMLTENNLCSIQRDYGEEYLSDACVTYPRRTYSFEKFYERALTLTCPIVAEKVLLYNEPMKFERVEVPEIIHSNLDRISISFSPVPIELWEYIIDIQTAAIYILQARSLPIDTRLIVLGFFLDRLAEMIDNYQLEEIEKLTAIYTSADFLKQYAPIFAQSFTFDVREHIKIIFGILEDLEGTDKKFIDAIISAFQIDSISDYHHSLAKISTRYNELNNFRRSFVEDSAAIFENYLVNEFFMNQYPFKFEGSITYNYGVFVAIYKILELISVTSDKNNLLANIMIFVNNIDHNDSYINKIAESLSGKDDTVILMQSLLQS